MTRDEGDDALHKLEILKRIYEQQLIPAEEYENRRKLLLDRHLGQQEAPRSPSPEPRRPRRPTVLDDLEEGREIGPDDSRFHLIREIGGGGMGRIWLARDLNKELLEGGEHYKALKVIAPQLQDHPRALEDLKREAIRASELSHPNIVNVYGWRQGDDGWLFVVMDYLQGRDLDRLLLDEGTPGLNWSRTLEILEPMVAALDHAHREHRLVHRDLKLGNVFITERGVVKLLDFGLAYRLRRSSTIINMEEQGRSGTPVYLPPESHVGGGGEIDNVSQDIYALACMTYEMLSGDSPYSREASIYRDPDLVPNPPGMLSTAAWDVLRSGFAHDVKERPTSVRAFMEGLLEGQGRRGSEPRSDTQAVRSIHGWPAAKLLELQQEVAQHLGRPVVFADTLADQRPGPKLVVVPDGEFLMGSPEEEPGHQSNERRHRVLIKRPFAIGRWPLTFDEYLAFIADQGGEGPDDEGWGRGRRPVIHVSWDDAMAYCQWLSQQTGHRYRLPSEAEWEHAIRAGSATAFAWGDTIGPRQANYDTRVTHGDGLRGEYREATTEVGLYPTNTWGLYDGHGNVWEWTGSDYDEHYGGAERHCCEPGASGSRVLRGGAWSNEPLLLRCAYRFWYGARLRNFNVGFRVVREL